MLVHVQHCMPSSWRVSSLPILYKPFTKQSILEPLAPHDSGGRVCQILSKCFKSFYKSFTSRCILKHLAPHGSGGRICQTFPNASNPLQVLYKTEHCGASGGSWLRRPDLPDPFQRLHNLYKSFTKRSTLESIVSHVSGGRTGASGASWLRRPDLPDPFQRLQILYTSFTKRSILEPPAPRGSGGRIFDFQHFTFAHIFS